MDAENDYDPALFAANPAECGDGSADSRPRLSTQDAVAAADQVAEHWVNAAKSLVLACSYLVKALNAFEQHPEILDAFLARLATKCVVSENDVLARLKANGKVAMLKKIGCNAVKLLQPAILCLLPAHYSIIYQICLLIEEIGLEPVVAWLLCHHDTTRDDVIKKRAASKVPDVERGSIAATPLDDNVAQLFALRLTAQEWRVFANEYVQLETLDKCLRRFNPADDAGLVAIVPIRMLGTFERALMPLLGFSAPNRVFLATALDQPEITDSDVVVVAHRGRLKSSLMAGFPHAADVLYLAERFFPNCRVKCQLFANVRANGWSTFIGDENWHQKPSVR